MKVMEWLLNQPNAHGNWTDKTTSHEGREAATAGMDSIERTRDVIDALDALRVDSLKPKRSEFDRSPHLGYLMLAYLFK